jgi:Fe-S-cluster-containing dehydrogenase component
MGNVFYVDVARCSGCYNCQLACKDEHVGNDWSPYAKPQPQIGQFWCRVDDHPQGTVPKVRIHYIPHFCNHCRSAKCMDACPAQAITRREDGLVLIDPAKCSGCKACLTACPYGAIYFNDALRIAQKCTGCAHLLDHGAKQPRCVEACPTGALRFGGEDDLRDLIEGAAVQKPETGCAPRVYYRNIPGKFIAGTVYDPVEKEVVIGAKCRLNCGGKLWETVTDAYGDFWFDDLAVGVYDLVIEAEGYEIKTFFGLRSRACVNLGDIPLDRTKK